MPAPTRPRNPKLKLVALKLTLALLCLAGPGACTSLVSRATDGMAANLNSAILNQRDPAVVRDGAPAYLLMLDSFVEGAPEDPGALIPAAELYAMYGALFTQDTDRAMALTQQGVDYARRALCAVNRAACGMDELAFGDFTAVLDGLRAGDVAALYTYGLSWAAHIRASQGDLGALSKLPRVQAAFERVRRLEPAYRPVQVAHYLAVLNTARPPAMGGDFDTGRQLFESALEASQGRDLGILVDYANFYARTLYERELHDRLLRQALETDPVADGQTLFNVMAQQRARALLDSADDHF